MLAHDLTLLDPDAIRDVVSQLAAAARREDHYAVLGIDVASSDAEVRRAAEHLTAQLRLEAVRQPGLEELAERVDVVREGALSAADVLLDPERRNEYDRRRRLSDTQPVWDPPAMVNAETRDTVQVDTRTSDNLSTGTMARVLNMRGGQYMARGDYDRAERLLRRAVEYSPEDPVYRLRLGWSIFQNVTRREPSERHERARPHLESAAAGLPWDAEARYCLAQFWREVGSRDRYRSELEATLRADPKHDAALAEFHQLLQVETLESADDEDLEMRGGVFGSIGRFFGIQ